MKNEATIGGITVAGQPTDEEIRALRSQGYSTVINVRMPEELDEPEAPKVEAAGLRYVSVPFTIATVTADDVKRIRKAIEGVPQGSKVLSH